MFLLLFPLLPMLLAYPVFRIEKAKKRLGFYALAGLCALFVLGLALLLPAAAKGTGLRMYLPYFAGFSLQLKLDGFRATYALIASFMWLISGIFSKEYLRHGENQARYLLFTLITLGATLGVFLSDDLITCFVFFEIMSFSSYPWVAHEENPKAMRAAATYLAIAVFGGMAMLMGFFLLYLQTGSFAFDALLAYSSQAADKTALYLPSVLILIGFGAKAGMFPLHVWLPKAHPVAPAPASALLSGVLTKVGVFGILVLSSKVLLYNPFFARLVFVFGLITMFLGAVLALLSIDLKETLACSSMSQIGFILFGIGMQGLLMEHNSLAAQGTFLHMINHSLIKLVLFCAAGVVYMNTHRLNLNDIKGYGRNKPLLHIMFLIGAASISGLPLFSGYLSKTLLHESLVEYIAHLSQHGQSTFIWKAAEWLFIVSGGITFCYMLKLYSAIFIKKPAQETVKTPYMRFSSRIALSAVALLLLLLGILYRECTIPFASLSLPFVGAHAPAHAVDFLSSTNLIGAFKSLVIGALLYAFFVERIMVKNGVYRALRPEKADLENSVYRPLLRRISLGMTAISKFFSCMPDLLFAFLKKLLFIPKVIAGLPDYFFLRFSLFAFRTPKEKAPVPIGNRISYALGVLCNKLSQFYQSLKDSTKATTKSYIVVFAKLWEEASTYLKKLSHGLSFSLMMFSLGLLIFMIYMFLL